MKNGWGLENGDQNSNMGSFYNTAASVSYFAGYSATVQLPDTDMGIGLFSMIGSPNSQMDMTGGQLVFQDKFAVVTGAASGIGLACVEQLQDFGYQLQLLDIHPIIGSQIEKIDLSKEIPRLKRAPDVVVCSHGIGGLGHTWEEVIATNLYGVRNVVEESVRLMLEEDKGGSIVLIASMTGPIVGNKG